MPENKEEKTLAEAANESLKIIAENTVPKINFADEQHNNEQVKRDEQQLSFLERMAEGIDNLGEEFKELDMGGGFVWLSGIATLLGQLGAVILAPITAILGFFKGLQQAWQKIKFPTFKKMLSPIIKLTRKFNFLAKDISALFKKIPGVNKILKGIDGIGKFFTTMGKWFTTSSSSFAKLSMKIFRIGKMFGRFNPIILAVVTAVKSLWEGFKVFKKTGSLIETLKTMVVEAIDFMIVSFAEIGKDILSWVSKKLGFEGFAEILDSFDFSKLFREGMGQIFTLVDNFWKGVFNSFNNIIGTFKTDGIVEASKTFMQDFVGYFLGFTGDILKDLTAWAAGALGFKEMEATLLEFSISDLVNETIDKIFKFFQDLLDVDMKALIESLPYGKAVTKFLGIKDKSDKLASLEKEGYFTDDMGRNTFNKDKVKEGLAAGDISKEDLKIMSIEANLDSEGIKELMAMIEIKEDSKILSGKNEVKSTRELGRLSQQKPLSKELTLSESTNNTQLISGKNEVKSTRELGRLSQQKPLSKEAINNTQINNTSNSTNKQIVEMNVYHPDQSISYGMGA